MKRLLLVGALFAPSAFADQVVQLNVHRGTGVLPGQALIVQVKPSLGVRQALRIPGSGNFSDAWWFTDALNTSEWTIKVRNETCFQAICQGKVRFPLPTRYVTNPNIPGTPGQPGIPLEKSIFVEMRARPNGQVICSIRTDRVVNTATLNINEEELY